MTTGDALAIFAKYTGRDPSQIYGDLKDIRNRLVMKYHPDHGGDLDTIKKINAAYDVLSPKTKLYDDDDEVQEKESEPLRNGVPVWAWAGYAGGAPPNAHISRNNYTDLNYIKKRMWELSDQSPEEYTLWAYDGYTIRGSFTVYGNERIYHNMVDAMLTWEGGTTRAIFASKKNNRTLYLLYANGRYTKPIQFRHDSPNMNPANDQEFMRNLPEVLARLKGK